MGREEVLLAVDRKVVGVFRDHDLGRHTCVVPISLDQAHGPRCLDHATLRSLRAGKLGDSSASHDQLWRDHFQRLLPVVADHLPLAVLGTGLLILGHVELHLVPRQVGRELFVARL